MSERVLTMSFTLYSKVFHVETTKREITIPADKIFYYMGKYGFADDYVFWVISRYHEEQEKKRLRRKIKQARLLQETQIVCGIINKERIFY